MVIAPDGPADRACNRRALPFEQGGSRDRDRSSERPAGTVGLRQMAPTRLTAGGVAEGLVAGRSGAAPYAIACPENSFAFLSVWHLGLHK
ncbi:MAG: hypothetical protein CMH94_00685 [Oceanicaulis sp.]|nr:hypothetical protein [Oceanicaulis sp.]MBI74110.1 hypothetical protein [Oceanicaulis sp.]